MTVTWNGRAGTVQAGGGGGMEVLVLVGRILLFAPLYLPCGQGI